MRRLLASGVLAVACAAMLAGPAGAQTRRCALRHGEKVLLRNSDGLVSERRAAFEPPAGAGTRSRYYACVSHVGRRVAIGRGEEFDEVSNRLQAFTVAGRFVTFVRTRFQRYLDTYLETVEQFDLVSGKRSFAKSYDTAGGPLITEAKRRGRSRPNVVANELGDAAWAMHALIGCGWSGPCPGEAVVVHDARKLTTVSIEPILFCFGCGSHPVRFLRLSDTAVEWAGEGKPMSAPLVNN